MASRLMLIALALIFIAQAARAQDAITLQCANQSYNGDPAFKITVDTLVVNPNAPCSQAPITPPGTWTWPATPQTITFNGAYGGSSTVHTITITFLNDAWGGSPTLDRNLMIGPMLYDGVATKKASAGGKYGAFNAAGQCQLATTNDWCSW